MPRGASHDRRGRPRGPGAWSCECLPECERIYLALGGQRLIQSRVSRREIQRFGLGLAIARRQVHVAVAAGGDLGLEFGEQRLGMALAPVTTVGPDGLELGGGLVEAAEWAGGEG